MSFSFNLSPLAAFVLGLLLGFIIEWLLELLYFRRRRRACEERLAHVEADLQERQRELLAMRTQADAWRNDLGAAQMQIAALQTDLQSSQAAALTAQGLAGDLRTELDARQTQFGSLEADRQALDARLTAALGELEQMRLQVSEANARRDSLDAALQARDAANAALTAELNKAQTQQAAAQDELERLRWQVDEANARRDSLDAALQTRDAANAALTAELNKAQTQQAAAQDELERLRWQVDEASARRDSLDAALQARDAAYTALAAELAAVRTQALTPETGAQLAAGETDRLRSQMQTGEERLLAAADEKVIHLDDAVFASDQRRADLAESAHASAFGQPAPDTGDAVAGAGLATGFASAFGAGETTPESAASGGAVEFGGATTQPGGLTGAHVSACPQDLSKIKGVGQAYETRLYAAGIGTYWELANASDDDLRRILEIKGYQKVDLASIKAQAHEMAAATDAIGRRWDASPPDDLESLAGVGAVFEGRLYDAGICTYRALANATVEQLAAICPAPTWRQPDYAGWIRQAQARLGEE